MFYSYTHHLFKENSFFLLRSWSCCVAVPEHELKKLREVTTKKKKYPNLSLTLILTTTVRLCSSYSWNCLPSACTHIKYNSVVGYHFWFCLQCLLVSLLPYIFCHTKHSCTEKKIIKYQKGLEGMTLLWLDKCAFCIFQSTSAVEKLWMLTSNNKEAIWNSCLQNCLNGFALVRDCHNTSAKCKFYEVAATCQILQSRK